MTEKRQTLRLLAILIVLAAGLSAPLGAQVKTGEKAPNFFLTAADGSQIRLSDLQGKAVLLHFWATWCPPCVAELPLMDALAGQLSQEKNPRIEFLAVCVSDTEKNRIAFMKKNKYTFNGILDESGTIALSYGIMAIPTSILISPDGTVEKVNVGAMSEERLFAFISQYEK